MDYLSFEVHYYLRHSFTEVIKCVVGSETKPLGYGAVSGHVFKVESIEGEHVVLIDTKDGKKYVLENNSVDMKEQRFHDEFDDVESIWIRVTRIPSAIDSEYLLTNCLMTSESSEKAITVAYNTLKKGLNEIILDNKELQPKINILRQRADIAFQLCDENKFCFPFILTKRQGDEYANHLMLEWYDNQPDYDFITTYFEGADRIRLLFNLGSKVKLPFNAMTTNDYIRLGFINEKEGNFELAKENYEKAQFTDRLSMFK